MDDLGDASDQGKKRPIPLSIDLNETPPSPSIEAPPPSFFLSQDAFSLVCKFHGNLAPAEGSAAEFPGEAGVGGALLPCGICGLAETWGSTVVCDGCERGFHLVCLRSRQRQQALAGDWVCGECVLSRASKKRWTLGAVRLLDINELPPSEGDGEMSSVGEEFIRSGNNGDGMNNPDEASLNGGFRGQYPCPNMVRAGNAFDMGNHIGTVTDTMQTSSEAILYHGLNKSRGFEDLVLGSSLRGRPAVNSATVSGQFKGELFLHYLGDFITKKGGFLGEGWHIEFEQPSDGSDSFAVYCAPDGKKFESMFDVAHYLGISSGFTPMEIDERSDGSGTVQRPLPTRRRKKDLTRMSITNKFIGNQDSVRSSCGGELSSDAEITPQYSHVRSASRFTKSYREENGVYGSQNLSVGLPVQYEDFFVICLGKVDLRTAYHDNYQIWPIGYKSIWHDKVTGSLFECEVSDGGDSGPVFKVRRCPCSLSPIPIGTTILLHNKANKTDNAERTESSSFTFDAGYDKDEDILMLLSDPNPSEQDFLSCFGRDMGGNSYGSSMQIDMKKPDVLTTRLNCHPESSGEPSDKGSSLRDEIGEFYVEGRSSSSVWMMVSQTLIDACHEVYKQSGCLQFCCRHDYGVFSSCSDDGTIKDVHNVGSLARFCCASGPINTPRVIRSDNELEASCKLLTEWLEQDRFGLDMGFVQEIVETLPASRACSRYLFLNERSDFSLSWTVGSGLLLAIQNNGERGGEEVVSYGLYSGKNRSRLAEDPPLAEQRPPPGRPLNSKLPAELVGDVFQIWEFLWRFHEILGLKEPLSFEELEEELIDPWPCGLNHLERIEKENQDCRDQNSLGTESADRPASLPTGVSDSTIYGQNLFKLIPVETAAMREAAQAKVGSRTYGRCTGVVLSKAHISLLKVLVGELLSKVAVFLDPNFDARESKSRRGRKKDMENSFPIKEIKNELLTFNELTWPELARRYVLAVLSMNGRMESQEVCGRESVKVFRCLQGDGGVLCGSLSGVAGMEADALLLAEAERQISDSAKREKEVLPVDCKDSEAVGACEPAVFTSSSLPEWAQPLEPVKKLPTNVGTRIRKCIYNSLEKDPPEWAKKILQHSISKEVYKGNASGPTKKAVLSVLAKVTGGSLQQKPAKGPKGESPLSLSDAIMKKCRIVLRSAASADEKKVFCNLLGSTLLNSNDNDDEGILGSPAMVSRPLDFRTIDLRLAVGAYGGSHETFLEDVREVWRNLCTAYGDRPDLLQMLERLSQNFESLYEKEVLHLTQKFAHHSAIERLDAETQKELNDILLGANEIPKAPWEDGVCKVCGIDKDDDSVLLCDSCDSEYHKYCLNPPLARIPDGNWYCPSCVVGQHKMQDASQCTQAIKSHPRRYLGDETRAFQEALNQLATTMEEREYWEFNIEERIFLLKFLCDEVLNSAVIREHLEQCVDKSNDPQQKLRSLIVDWRNLKFKEESLAMRTVKEITSKSSGTGVVTREEGTAAMHANPGRLIEQQQHFNSKLIYTTNLSGSPLTRASIPLEGCLEENGQTDVSNNMGQLLKSMIEKHANGNKPQTQYGLLDPMVAECGTHSSDGHVLNEAAIHGNPFSIINLSNGDEFYGKEQSVVSSQKGNEARGEVVHGGDHGNVCRRLIGVAKSTSDGLDIKNILNVERNGTVQSNADILHGSCLSSENGRTHLGENTLSMTMGSGANMSAGKLLPSLQNTVLQGNHFDVHAGVTESEASNLEADSLKNEISQLQDSIASLESQLMMTSLRRDFLGRDAIGRLYWVIGRPGKRPWLVAGGSMPVPWERRKTNEIKDPSSNSLWDLASSSSARRRNICPGISYSCNPSDYDLCYSMWSSSPLVLYESDCEIQQLVGWLRDGDPRERELKECILQWQRLVFHQQSIYIPNDPKSELKYSVGEKFAASHCSTTKSAIILENKYGPCLDLEVSENPKKRGRKAKVSHEERMYRCECLEPVWPSRHHCLSCHQTFYTVKELEGHNDGRCTPTNPASDESKESDEPMKGKGIRSESTGEKEHSNEVDTVETSKKGKFDISSKLVKFQRKACPYDLDQISRKFITNNSNKELVKDIGLIGSNGVPSLISSPPMFFDPPLILNQSKTYDNDLNKRLATSNNWLLMSTQSVGANVSHGDIGNGSGHDTKSPHNCLGNGDQLPDTTLGYACAGGNASSKVQGSKVIQSCTIPESSLRPLVGKVSYILKRLKINLLDMDAALPEEALRPSKSLLLRRCAWRAFVKSAESIFEIVQATVLLEGMIKTDYLKNGWWYWSSLTAAAKTPTISSLALRIYTLDDSIIYIKDKDPQLPTSLDPPTESLRLTNKTAGKKRKDMADVGPE